MFRFLVRYLRSSDGPCSSPTARRFAPGLEVLDGRTMPSALAVGAAVEYLGAHTPGAESPVLMALHIGEEIPQQR